MKKQLFALALLSIALAACDQHDRTKTRDNTQNRSANNQAQAADYKADNTGRNARDRDRTLTAGNQAENENDRTITQKIRQAIMDDDSLSTNAKNIKIITISGVVTLRGPVNNEREKSVIGQKAKSVNGVRNVDNQIEIIRKAEGSSARMNTNDASQEGMSRSDSYR